MQTTHKRTSKLGKPFVAGSQKNNVFVTVPKKLIDAAISEIEDYPRENLIEDVDYNDMPSTTAINNWIEKEVEKKMDELHIPESVPMNIDVMFDDYNFQRVFVDNFEKYGFNNAKNKTIQHFTNIPVKKFL